MNATLLVVTNSEDGGGLYNCADITFTSAAVSSLQCSNGTGVGATSYTGSNVNANGTGSATTTATAAVSTSTKSSSAVTGSVANVGAWMLMMGGAVGVAALL